MVSYWHFRLLISGVFVDDTQVWWPTFSWVAPRPSWTKAWKRRVWTSAAWTSASPRTTSRVWAQLPGTLSACCSGASPSEGPPPPPACRSRGSGLRTSPAETADTGRQVGHRHRRVIVVPTSTPPGSSPSSSGGNTRTTSGPWARWRPFSRVASSTTPDNSRRATTVCCFCHEKLLRPSATLESPPPSWSHTSPAAADWLINLWTPPFLFNFFGVFIICLHNKWTFGICVRFQTMTQRGKKRDFLTRSKSYIVKQRKLYNRNNSGCFWLNKKKWGFL